MTAEITISNAALRDREFGPAVWLLLSDCLADRTRPFIDLGRRRIDFEALLGMRWSHGEGILVELAANLWGGGPIKSLNPVAWATLLGPTYWLRIIEALTLAAGRTSLRIDWGALQ